MSESFVSLEQNLTDAGCDKDFIEKFMILTEERRIAHAEQTASKTILTPARNPEPFELYRRRYKQSVGGYVI